MKALRILGIVAGLVPDLLAARGAVAVMPLLSKQVPYPSFE